MSNNRDEQPQDNVEKNPKGSDPRKRSTPGYDEKNPQRPQPQPQQK